MPEVLELEGEVVEQQSYLNGTRYLLIAAESEPWSAQLSLTLPREEGEPLREGDLSLDSVERAWQGVAASGEHRSAWDDSVEASVLNAEVRFVRAEDEQAGTGWDGVVAHVRVVGTAVLLRLEPSAD
jgi:hypothetical protein